MDDACTSLGDADSYKAGLAMEVESRAEMAGSESRADVALKDESAACRYYGRFSSQGSTDD